MRISLYVKRSIYYFLFITLISCYEDTQIDLSSQFEEPSTVASFTMVSDNLTNNKYARSTDQITVNLNLSAPAQSVTVVIAGLNASVFKVSDLVYSATVNLAGGEPDGPLAFVATIASGSQVTTYTSSVSDPEAVIIKNSVSTPSALAKVTPLDTITANKTPTVRISGVEEGATVRLFSDNCTTEVGLLVASSNSVDIITSTLPKGDLTFYAQQTDLAGNVSACSTANVNYIIAGTPMVSTWQTTTSNEMITLPLRTGFNYNMTVDWGDGSPVALIDSFGDADKSHTYALAGTYTVTLTGTAEAWYFNNGLDKDKIMTVPELGDMNWVSFEGAFLACDNLTTVSGGVTDGVTTMRSMFHEADNVMPDTSGWVTDNVQSMYYTFAETHAANPDTSNWNTENVLDMSGMFLNADAANPNTTNWNVESVVNMTSMFRNTAIANPNTSNWVTTDLEFVTFMFRSALMANPNTTNWNMASVSNMAYMFYGAPMASPDTSNWITTNVVNMSFVFSFAGSANPDPSTWDLTNVTSLTNIFHSSGISTANYSQFLIRAEATSSQAGLSVTANAEYNVAGGVARAALAADHSWSFTDDGPE